MAKPVECRIAIEGTSSCNPYSMKLLRVQHIDYRHTGEHATMGRERSSKVVEVPAKVVPVEEPRDYIDYTQVEEPVRFRGKEELESQHSLWKKKEEIYTRIEAIRTAREAFFAKMQAERAKREAREQEAIRVAKEEERKLLEEKRKHQGYYTIKKGDSLGKIAQIFDLKISEIKSLNGLKKKALLKVGQSLLLPYPQEKIDAIATGEYRVKSGDTLGHIAQKFGLTTKAIKEFNHFKRNTLLRINEKILLPFPHKLAEMQRYSKYGRHELRVTATAYSSHANQTDSTPFLAAWNNRLAPGMKVIAVSRDLLKRYGMRNGTKVRISGLSGLYEVRDKMNKRYRKRIDIYMGLNRKRALRWGRRSVVIHW